MRRSLVFLVVLFSAATLSAGTITSINPTYVKVNSGEWFLTINGTGLGDTVVFDGPGGHFSLKANAVFTTNVVCWIPLEVIANAGYYDVYVLGGTGQSNVVTFEVRGFRFFPLVILVPEVLRAQPINIEGAYVKYEVIVMGSSDPVPPKPVCTPESGAFFKMGATSVRCTATSQSGERAQTSFDVIVRDEEAPVVKVPEPIQVKAESREGAIVDYRATAYDDIYGDVEPECLPRSGSMFPIGLNEVRCSATDTDGNIGHAGFTVEVLSDREPYVLTIVTPEEPISVPAKGAEGTEVGYDVKVTGTDDPRPELTCNPKSGSIFPIGQTAVVCDAIDTWGMRGHAEFPVEVFDPEAPVIEKVTATPDDLSPADGRIVPVTVEVSAFDAIDRAPSCTVFAVTSNEDIDLGDGDDPKQWQWTVTGPLALELRAAAETKERVYTVWVGCSDFWGNITNTTVDVLVWNDKAPTNASATPKRRSVGGRP